MTTHNKITDIKQLPRYKEIESGEIADYWIRVGLTKGPRVAVEDVFKFFEMLNDPEKNDFPLEHVVFASNMVMAGRATRLLKGGVSLAEFHGKDVPDEWIEEHFQKATTPYPQVTRLDSFLCQHNVDWIADAMCYEGTDIDLTETMLYKPLVEGAGWSFYDKDQKTVVMSPRTQPELNNEGFLHNDEGPVFEGIEVYALQGLVLPKEYNWVVTERDTLTPQKINEITNAEVRRVVIGTYPEKYVQGEPVQSDDYGDLFRVSFEESEFNFGVVRVKNACDEKIYWLRVPYDVETAHQGVAATFGMTPEEYQPQIQT